jgi:hypothetical protein
MDLNELKEEIAFQRELRSRHVRRVRILKLQKAERGLSCPPEILIEIEDIEQEISSIDTHIKNMEEDLLNRKDVQEDIADYSASIEELSIELIGELTGITSRAREIMDAIIRINRNKKQ